MSSVKTRSIKTFMTIRRPLTIKYKQILSKISEEVQWRGPILLLLKRIKKILNNSRFSVRQIIQLKRIMKRQYKYKDLDYHAFSLKFPGKSVESIIDMCNQILIEKGKMV